MRLDKYLADMGAGTRSELKRDIKKGLAKIDGRVISDPGFSVPAGANVTFRGLPVSYEDFSYFMLHKPSGVITATEDKRQHTVLDLINEPVRTDLFPVGRLDKDTEGLLLITNDGDLAHRLLSPKHHVDKIYFARIEGAVTLADANAFAEGLMVDDDLTAMPADLKILRSDEISEVLVTIREGKFHQIKRMFHAVGKEVVYLKRLSMGSLKLDESLAAGEYRRLTDEELCELKELAGL